MKFLSKNNIEVNKFNDFLQERSSINNNKLIEIATSEVAYNFYSLSFYVDKVTKKVYQYLNKGFNRINQSRILIADNIDEFLENNCEIYASLNIDYYKLRSTSLQDILNAVIQLNEPKRSEFNSELKSDKLREAQELAEYINHELEKMKDEKRAMAAYNCAESEIESISDTLIDLSNIEQQRITDAIYRKYEKMYKVA
jgi:hypothetical protein